MPIWPPPKKGTTSQVGILEAQLGEPILKIMLLSSLPFALSSCRRISKRENPQNRHLLHGQNRHLSCALCETGRALRSTLRVLSRALWEHFRKFPCSRLPNSPIFQQHQILSLPGFGCFSARKMAARKLDLPSGMLLDFLLRDRHSLLDFFLK